MFFKRELLDVHKTQVELRKELMATGRFETLSMPEISLALSGASDTAKPRLIRHEATKIIERWKKCSAN